MCKGTLKKILATQDIGLDRLKSVDQLLVKGDRGSRTASYQGYEIDGLRSERSVELYFNNL